MSLRINIKESPVRHNAARGNVKGKSRSPLKESPVCHTVALGNVSGSREC